ncbi:MAG: hypothetical protein Q7J57_14320 [Gemmobacter sp.]|nr:hypothetical protein [Gemmobacter sp.]
MPPDPFIAAMVRQLAARPALSAGTPQEARAMVAASRALLGKGPELAQVRDVSVLGG